MSPDMPSAAALSLLLMIHARYRRRVRRWV